MKTVLFNRLIAAVALAATSALSATTPRASGNDQPIDNAGAAQARIAAQVRQREEPVSVIVDGLAPDLARAITRRAALGRTYLVMYLERGRFTYESRVEHGAKAVHG